jgi:hypothetical protein
MIGGLFRSRIIRDMDVRALEGWRSTCLLATVAVWMTVGCGKLSGRPDLQATNPLDRARGVVIASNSPSETALAQLIERLEDRDPAVRMYAILGLRRLTGQDLGYRYHASDAERAVAAERWRQALERGEITLRAPGAVAAAERTSHSEEAPTP